MSGKEPEDPEVEAQAAKNPPVNVNVATGSAAATSGVNVKPVGGADLPNPGAASNKPTGGSPTWESGEGTPAPTLGSISPTGAVSNGGDFSLTCTGTNFLTTSVISFNGVMQDTTYISATQVRATIPNTTGQTAGVKPVVVFNGPTATSAVNCTYT